MAKRGNDTMKEATLLLLVTLMISTTAYAEVQDKEYIELAWHNYQAARICVDTYKNPNESRYVDECIRLQNICKLIYDGILADSNRKWLAESKAVKNYIVDRGLKPIDYAMILKIISHEQTNVDK